MPEEIQTAEILTAPVFTPNAEVVVDSPSSATLTPEARTALEDKVSSKLAEATGEEPDAEEEASKTTEEIAAEAVEAAGLEKTDEQEVVDQAAKDAEEAAAQADAAKETPASDSASTLPASYVRALKADEWTDDEIASASKDPNFINVAAKIHQRRNTETARWAEAGRKLAADPARQAAAESPQITGEIPLIDVSVLKEQYGDDKLIQSIIGPVNATAARINAILPMVMAMQQQSQASEVEQTAKEISTFFAAEDMKPFAEVYGPATGKLSSEQIETRNKVLEYASALNLGARAQGQTLTLSQVLTLAHDAVSSDFKKQAVRTQIQQTLTKRNKAITNRPGAKPPKPASGQPATRTDLEKKVNAGLASVFA